jgi:hypothetical protein
MKKGLRPLAAASLSGIQPPPRTRGIPSRGAKNLVTLALYVAGIIVSSFGEGGASSPLVCVPLGPGVGGRGGGVE